MCNAWKAPEEWNHWNPSDKKKLRSVTQDTIWKDIKPIHGMERFLTVCVEAMDCRMER